MKAAVILLLVIVGSCSGINWLVEQDAAQTKAAQQKANDESAARVAAAKAERVKRCEAQLVNWQASFDALYSAKDYKGAAESIRECANVAAIADPRKAALKRAEAQVLIGQATDKTRPLQQRIADLRWLELHHAEEYSPYRALAASLQRTADLEAKAEQRRIAAEKRREGVSIGMSQQDVLDSSWGKPRKINRTTYSWGTKEQWVYDGGYL
jgi:hypothetical protein